VGHLDARCTFNGLPEGHPRLLFKGGTSLSKAYGLISMFSEDIDITVFRGRPRPTCSIEQLEALSRKKRQTRLDEIKTTCREYIQGMLLAHFENVATAALTAAGIEANGPRVVIAPDDPDGQSLLFWYPSVTATQDNQFGPP
jgi:hypothetical protein